MNILILGASQVGETLATELLEFGHDITMVDTDYDRLSYLQRIIDIRVVKGNPSYPEVLKEAEAKRADVLIAVCKSDEINMIACQVAYSLFEVMNKIASIRSPHYFIRNELFGDQNLPIDYFINPEKLVSESIASLLSIPGVSKNLDLANGDLRVLGFIVDNHKNILKMKLKKLKVIFDDFNCVILGLLRQGEYIPLSENPTLILGDEVIVLVASHQAEALITLLYDEYNISFDNVIVVGGGNVGSLLSKNLSESGITVKLIERNKYKCQELAKKLDRVTVIHGDVAEKRFLHEENIANTDVFCAMTNDDEDNIISSLQAKYQGAKYCITLVNNSEYLDIFNKSEIDVLYSPQQSTISSIMNCLRSKGSLAKMHSLNHSKSEILEMRISKKLCGHLIGKKVTVLNISSGIIFCCIWRKGEMITAKNSIINNDDSIIFLLTDKTKFKKLEAFFSN